MQRPLKNASFGSTFNDDDTFDLDGLLHPAQAFEHPSHVVTDPDLTLNEKARDPCVVGVGCLCDRSGSSFPASARGQTCGRLRRSD